MEPYVYQPLAESGVFRLLELEWSDDPSEPIRCSLKDVPLDVAPEYEALSYCWGERVEDEPIIYVDGRTLRVTKSLHPALFHLRLRKLPVWIDAVCINQEDTTERTRQVLQMRQIFSGASLVIAWLGEASDVEYRGFGFATRLIGELGNYLKDQEETHQGTALYEALNDTDPGSYAEEFGVYIRAKIQRSKLDPSQSGWSDGLVEYLAIFENDWFLRTWVIQEVVVAKQILVKCADIEIPWETLLLVSRLYDLAGLAALATRLSLYSPHSVSAGAGRRSLYILATLREEYPKEPAGFDLLSSMCLTHDFKATDARDKAFALAGITGSYGVPNGLEPNYDANNTFEELYHRLALQYLKNLDSDLLPMVIPCTICPLPTLTLPSWVPDWRQHSCKIAKITTRFHLVGGSGGFRASLDETPNFRLPNGGNILIVRGRMLDAISSLGDLSGPWADPRSYGSESGKTFIEGNDSSAEREKALTDLMAYAVDMKRFLKSFQTLLIEKYSGQTRYLTGQLLQEAFGRTLFCDRDALGLMGLIKPGGNQDFSSENSVSETRTDLAKALLEWLDLETQDVVANENLLLEASLGVGVWSKGRNWCITKECYIGWVPFATQEGDQVVIIDGQRTPFVLRPVEDGCYKLIGECYIHGVMDGEIMGDARFPAEDIFLI